MKILLLEDNARFNATIVKRLEAKGYHIDSFMDGQEAYDALDNGYACFLLDINVPSLDGIEILKKIRDFYPETPVIIMSSSVELEVIKDAYNFGCNDFLKKPFFIDELEIKIEKLCNIRHDIVDLGHECCFDFKTSLLRIGQEHEEHLSRKEKLLLNVLISEKGKVVTFDKIQAMVWEGNFASLDSIRSLMRRLRKKIPFECIETVVDVGYILRY
ncbi:response regulator transcription factor [Sulfurospirillum halorespirans]|uniref:Two component response regulator n=1 Tax=Sulfurospirillum halorespirans DSM 13726 TaxID=1193502 RepID=A0A1D7THZ8_9BACT|nr:response regulator transcription factor [Sulfurospirillum halorespirans]AOO64570.1 two component response regulator [Sulfurospirillum halorespirans DSM 13726]